MMINWKDHSLSIAVTSAVFFDQSAKWLRRKDQQGWLTDAKGPIGSRSEYDDRRYTLSDVKRIAVALRRKGIIDDVGLENCFGRVDGMRDPVFSRKKRRS